MTGQYSHPIGNIDYFPTLLEAAGAADRIPGDVNGRSFWPLIAGQDYRPHGHIFVERNYHGEKMPDETEYAAIESRLAAELDQWMRGTNHPAFEPGPPPPLMDPRTGPPAARSRCPSCNTTDAASNPRTYV
ncbi:MAG: hypothetical protein ACLFTU_09740 [Puniceicoccaceae bacterium]